jgi:hypothetical protein
MRFLSRKWELLPPQPRFLLRSACLADGSLPRATNAIMLGRSRRISRVGARIRWQLRLSPLTDGRTPKLAYTASSTTLAQRSCALRLPAPSRSSRITLPGGARRSASQARHPQQSDRDVVITGFIFTVETLPPVAMYFRRVRAVGRSCAAALSYVSTVVTPPAPAVNNLGVGLRRPYREETFGGMLGAMVRIAPARPATPAQRPNICLYMLFKTKHP